jgi:hypothetical protein
LEARGKRDERQPGFRCPGAGLCSDVLAQAFAAEGTNTLFTLMGDANMYWSASMADNQKVRLIHARHEHCCVPFRVVQQTVAEATSFFL